MRIARRSKSLRHDERGATIIEFALVAMPFLALLLATIETEFVFFAQQCLETAAEETSRQLITGSAQKAGINQAAFKTIACGNLPSFLSCDRVMVDVQSANRFADVDTTAPVLTYNAALQVTNAWQYAPGGPGSVVVMRVIYLLPVVSGPLGFDLATTLGGRRVLISTLVFKSEPYAS